MLLGIFYHGALSLALGFPWFVQDPSANQSLYVFQSWVHGFRMPLFFIISGYFAAMLWKKRGLKTLLTHRLRRILLPCLLGAITLVPLTNLSIFNAFVEGNQRRVNIAKQEPPEKNVWAAIRNFNADALKVHIDQGYSWNELHPEFQVTALSWAAIVGDLESTRVLIEHGCDPSIANPDRNTPLHAAMFFGHFSVAEYLMEQGADLTKKNNNGETPLQSLRVDPAVVPVIAGFLLVEVDPADVKHGRELIENKLKDSELTASETPAAQAISSAISSNQLGQANPNDKSFSERLNPILTWIATYPAFSYLWFLWFLWWYAVCFVILVGLISWIRSFWTQTPISWTSLKLQSPQAMLFWIALTLIPIDRMKSLGFLFGPDTSVGFIPDSHVFAYYAVFFLFGVTYYLGDPSQIKLGQCWRWLFPLTLLVIFPISLEINLGLMGIRDQWLASDWIRPLSVLSQSIFAWWMSVACIGLFSSCFQSEKPWVRYLSDSAYWLYLAHLPLVILIQSKIAHLSWNAFIKILLISLLSVALLLLSYELLVRRTWLGRLLNGSK